MVHIIDNFVDHAKLPLPCFIQKVNYHSTVKRTNLKTLYTIISGKETMYFMKKEKRREKTRTIKDEKDENMAIKL
jgi:hypothetical protein